MAAHQPGVWGIDIGQCALKALRLQNIDGVVTATAFDFVEHSKILSQPDADPDQLTREALEKFLSRNSLKGDQVAMSVPGQSGLARFVKLPPVEEKKITDIVKFEAKQQIPFNLDEVVWDYQKIGSGVVTDGFAMETEIGLFAIKRETVQRALLHFQELDIDVHLIQMAPLSLCNYISYDLLNKDVDTEDEEESGKKQCVVALDIGVESTNMVVTDGGRVIWQRPIPIGGNRFTRALTRELKLTFAKAEHLKRNATKSPDLKKILLALKPDLNEFVNEVQKSLNFFVSGHKDAHIQYLVGLGSAFKLPGLQKFLNEKLQLEVRKVSKFNRLEGDSVITAPVFTDNLLTFGIAYGLAAQGLKLARLQTNLLPQEIQLDRAIRAKKPWAVAAAAALLLGVAGMTFGYRLEYDAFASPEIRAAMEEGKQSLEQIKKDEEICKVKQDEFNRLHRDVRAIIAGQDERVNWVDLHHYINECLPRPDGKGPDGKELTDPEQKKYWAKIDGKGFEGEKAWKLFQEQQKGKLKSDSLTPEQEKQLTQLMQINLMNVNALYTDDLAAFFESAKKAGAKLDKLPPEDKAPPTGGGWVVELRGFTYHPGQYDFIVDTLLNNLANRHKKIAEAHKGGSIKNVNFENGTLTVNVLNDKNETTGKEFTIAVTDKTQFTILDKDEQGNDVKKDITGKPALKDKALKIPGNLVSIIADGDKATEVKVGKLELEPVGGRVSHAFVYRYKSVGEPTPGTYEIIKESYFAPLVGAVKVGDGSTGSTPTGSPAGWRPLAGSGADVLKASDPNAPAGKDPKETKETEKPRAEFVMLFVWKEPTPSAKSEASALATPDKKTGKKPPPKK